MNLLEQLSVIITSRWSVRKVGNYCPSKHRRCNYHCVVCKNILFQLFCLKSLFEWKYVVPLQPINENSSASDHDNKFRDITHN